MNSDLLKITVIKMSDNTIYNIILMIYKRIYLKRDRLDRNNNLIINLHRVLQ